MLKNDMDIVNVRLREDDRAVVIVDQTRLPNRLEYLELDQAEQMYQAIKKLQVRGAPAIGIFAAFSMYVLSRSWRDCLRQEFLRHFHETADYLNSSRPTAVNLSWALKRMGRVLEEHPELSPEQLLPLLKREALRIQEEDIAMCRAISEHGCSLLRDGMGVITHCNAGPLATSRYGTAQGPFYLAHERGVDIRVFADETRPLLQGARLTAFELQRAGVDVTLICDNMASLVMKNGWVDMCFVGCDRMAMNGDFANKIGTSGLAILAHHYGVPFYTLMPTSTIDRSCPDGAHIVIEERDPEEIRSLHYCEPMAPAGVKCFNPAFDVTDHSLLAGIITEKGICRPPFTESLAALFAEEEKE
ncbi:MAG: S-methyl-5-thioribose-1-phosphate isomerase [Firmicutes bacterium]|nr:S-methyl-5-thioribose-1-phosphate isomerase [Bacillota bacterium]